MLTRSSRPSTGSPVPFLLLLTALHARPAFPQADPDPAAGLERAISAAESSLHAGESEAAETHYRSVLTEGWSLMGALAAAEGRLPEAEDAFRRASAARIEPRPAVGSLAPGQRAALRRRVRAALGRAYLNLGVLEVQRQRFAGAAELLESAAALDPDLPQLQYSLGVSYFNAQQFARAIGPLSRALGRSPAAADLRRMLALSFFNTEAYDQAAALLRDDPQRPTDLALQFAYGLSLVRSGRAAEAEAIFSRLLSEHGDSAELTVVLGQAHAQQGDYDAAVAALQRALQLKPDVAEANATLGVIYLKQGRLGQAEQALRSELRAHSTDLKARRHLAVVLELEGQPQEASALLRAVLEVRPDLAEARYLLGKILLAQGSPQEAVEELEAARRLTPEEANIHYQLGQAYQRLGRTAQAEREFEVFRQLKDKRRGSAPETPPR